MYPPQPLVEFPLLPGATAYSSLVLIVLVIHCVVSLTVPLFTAPITGRSAGVIFTMALYTPPVLASIIIIIIISLLPSIMGWYPPGLMMVSAGPPLGL